MINTIVDALQLARQTFNPQAIAPGEERVIRVEVPVDPHDCLEWLRVQNSAGELQRRFFWQARGAKFAAAGIGVADEVTCDEHGKVSELFKQMQSRLGNKSGRARYYGGMRFDRQRRADGNWLPFGQAAFVLPRFELSRRRDKTVFAWHALVNRETDSGLLFEEATRLCRLLTEPPAWNADVPAAGQNGAGIEIVGRRDVPDLAGWTRMIQRVVDAVSIEDVSKVVLARCSSLFCAAPPDPLDIVHSLRQVDPQTYLFVFSLQDRAFLGAPPERLYKRAGTSIETEALAGTRPRGRDDTEDRMFGDELLHSEKDRHEHALVWERISRQLKMLGVDVDEQREVRLMRLARVQHLYSFVDGRVSGSVGETHLLEALHPTPAVGGEPRGMARDMIEELEDFDRGWYAGPIGWVANDASEFAVAIRSALAHGPVLHYFSGAGIVGASDPASEWSEIETKMSAFLTALDGGSHGR